VQLAAFAVALKVPLAHAAHVWSVVALPETETACPGMQFVHAAQAVAGLASWSHVPLAHACFGVAAPAQYVPTSHGAHTGGEVGVAAAVCSVPAAQAPSGRHVDWFGDDEYVPAAQAAHWRSALTLPGVLTYLPGAQVLQGVQLASLVVVLKLPLAHPAHPAHVRSAVAEGVLVT
jgi:hypothetical protein